MKERMKLGMMKFDKRHVQIGLAVLTLVLFVLGAGAPAISGGAG